MADTKISQMTQLLAPEEVDLLVIVDVSESQTKKITKLSFEESLRLAKFQGTTDDLTEGTVKLFWSQARFDNAFSLKTTDDLSQGVTNKYFTVANLLAALSSSVTTDHIAEGGTNLYWTNARFDTRFNTKTTDNLVEGVSNKYYTDARWDTRFNTKTTDNLVEGAVNKYFTNARFDTRLSTKTTDDIVEGVSNLYFTNARVDARILLQKGVANGLATLGADGKIPTSQIPEIAISRVFVVNDLTERDNLPDIQTGDVAKVLDFDNEGRDRTYIYNGATWIDITATDMVESFNGITGHVIVTTTQIPEGSNLYWTNVRFHNQFISKTTDLLPEGLVNLYFTEARVQASLGNLSLNDLGDVNYVTPIPIPGYYLSWSGTEWVSTPPQAFSDTKDLKATPTDQYPNFLSEKILGTTDRLVITNQDTGGGNYKVVYDVGSNIFDITQKTTDHIVEGVTNLFFTDERVDDRVAALIQNGTGISWAYNDAGNILTPTISLSPFSTTNLAEGTNLYFTNQRADDRADLRISVQKGVANGLATLGPDSKIPTAQLPALAISDVYVVADIAARDALTVEEGDVAKVLNNGSGDFETFIYDGSSWISLKSGDSVDSVNGQTGTVLLTTAHITEGSNLYYTDERVDDRVAALIQNGTGITWVYSDALNTLTPTISLSPFSTTNLAEGTNLYYTAARFNTAFAAKTTTDLAEGTNLYFTNERVDDRVAALLQANTNISWTYNDPSNTLTPVLNQVAVRTGAGDANKLLQLSTNGYVDNTVFDPDNRRVTNRHADATSTVNTTSSTFVAMTSMTITPPAGQYFVLYCGNMSLSANNTTLQFEIRKNGVAVSGSMRNWTQSNSTNVDSLITFANVDVNGTDTIEVYWRSNNGTTATVTNRSLQAIKTAVL